MRILYAYNIPALSFLGTATTVATMIIFFAGALTMMWGVIAEDDLRDKIKNAIYVIVFSAVLAILYHYSIGPGGPKKMRYKATVDETYTAREMMEKYEVINIEGEIYTLKNREGTAKPSLPVDGKR